MSISTHANTYTMRYFYFPLLLIAMLFAGASNSAAQVEELQSKYVVKVSTSTTYTLKEGQWYIMYNRGRKAYNFEDTTHNGIVFQSSTGMPAGTAITGTNAGYLVQVVARSAEYPGQYYIYTGLGHWYGDLQQNGQSLSTESQERYRGTYTITKLKTSGHWYLKSAGGFILDGNGNGNTAVAYGSDAPTTTDGNNDHAFYAVTIGEKSDLKGTATVPDLLSEGGLFRFVSQRSTSRSMEDPSTHLLRTVTTSESAPNQWWLLQPVATGGYTMRNYGTGLFVQQNSTANAQYTTGSEASTLFIKPSDKTSTTRANVTISSQMDYNGKVCMHDDASYRVINWNANNSSNENPQSDWELKPVEGLNAAEVKEHIDEICGYTAPRNGATVMIRNAGTGYNLCENSSKDLVARAVDKEDYAQLWVLEHMEGNRYALRNAKTGDYAYADNINRTTWSTTSRMMCSFAVSESDDKWQRSYYICGADYYMCETTQNREEKIINFMASDPAARWFFVESDVTVEDIEKAQAEYQAYNDIKDHLSTYNVNMCSFFTDSSCSELKPEYQSMEEAELRHEFTRKGLPEYLLQIALKVKNNTWEEEDAMAKRFRVADFQVYSSHIYSHSKVGMAFWYGRLCNPTGITVKAGDVLTVFCDQANPNGTQLQLELVTGTRSDGQLLSLNKGLNIFTFSEEANVYVFYQTTSLSTKLANCPNIRIHFEGARLNGYYDKTHGDNNETWAYLRKNLLKHSNTLAIKTRNFVFCMNSKLVQQACPTDMERLLRFWDNMAEQEDELMGVNDTYIPGYSEVCRNIFNCFSMTHDYMYATNFGTYYEEGTLSSIMSPSGIASSALWGPAHENGHLRQELINMVGTTESSNNLFSNVCVYQQGMTTQRAAAPATIYNHFANHTVWNAYDIWETTHMFYQFYLYFHVNGVMPDFYPRLFAKMRDDRMDQSNRADIRGKNEYLKLARAFCDIAQADLSELFAVYGFFEPVDRYHVGDYGDYYITTTQEDINETLEYMHRYPKKLGNILFIEDRVSPVLATYEGHKAGEYKQRRGDDQIGASATAGDVGQYHTFLETPDLPNYYYTVTTSGKISIIGSGAQGLVGFKVYNENGQLAFVSNRLTFTLPAALRSQNYTLVAAMADGSDIKLSTELPEGIHSATETLSGSYHTTTLYDLQGRPVQQPQRGAFYISGSKKIIR